MREFWNSFKLIICELNNIEKYCYWGTFVPVLLQKEWKKNVQIDSYDIKTIMFLNVASDSVGSNINLSRN